MEKLFKKKINFKKIRISNPGMSIWLVLPSLVLLMVTHYFFERPNNQVLGISTEYSGVATSGSVIANNKTETERSKWDSTGVVSLLFTGSHWSQYELGYPLLSSKGYLASISVPTGEVGLPGSLTWLNIKILKSRGWEIVSQSKNQICDKNRLNDSSVLKSEVVGSKDDLSRMGLEANLYLPPCGIVNPEVIKEVKNSYSGLITFGIDPNQVTAPDKYNLITRQVNNSVNLGEVIGWIGEAKRNHTWLILSFADISDAKNMNSTSTSLLTQTLTEISKSGISVALPREVLNYGKP